jgi:uncharacterized flavoprotein (TIGR03862 family)
VPRLDCDVAIVGGGPAGLMAAEVLARHGRRVDLFDAMPSVGRKFLLAGKGGLNLTHSEEFGAFVDRYGSARAWLEPMLRHFGAAQLRAWAGELGIETFVGSSGRVFPREMKAAPLLRRWLQRLRGLGVQVHTRHRFTGFGPGRRGRLPPALHFDTPSGECVATAEAALLALGGASWPALGSDGAWVPMLLEAGVAVSPLRPANCGFDVARCSAEGLVTRGWSEHFHTRFVGAPLKGARLHWIQPDGRPAAQVGEFVITQTGVEGSLVYAASAGIRDEIAAQGHAVVTLDLLAQRDAAGLAQALAAPRGSRSVSTWLKSRLGLDGLRLALLYELLPRDVLQDASRLGAALKAVPLRLASARPVAEAISTAGGVRREALDEAQRLVAMPGVFCAGEMLDWEAPTGGYLLTACFATGVAAADGVLGLLERRPPSSRGPAHG